MSRYFEAEEAAYTPAELEAYDKYWDAVSVERTLMSQSEKKGREIGREEGLEIGREEGKEIGRKEERVKAHQEKLNMARKMLVLGMEKQQISQITGLPLKDI